MGKLQPDDPRVSRFDFASLAQRRFNREWPAPGDLLVVVAERVLAIDPPPSPTVRGIALDPVRFEDQRVSVRGRFRGRNLYGDLPDSPGKGRNDFVLQLADGAIWVTGLQPRGRDFHLNPESRQDTGTWLEATGVVKQGRGLVWIEATELKRTAAVDVDAPEPPPPPIVLPPPEVVFSAPTQDETDVAPDTNVRVQFSRPMAPLSFNGNVVVRYAAGQSLDSGAPAGPAIDFKTSYDEARRMLEIVFITPLERFRSVEVELTDAIKSTDEAPLKAWKLTFVVGG